VERGLTNTKQKSFVSIPRFIISNDYFQALTKIRT